MGALGRSNHRKVAHGRYETSSNALETSKLQSETYSSRAQAHHDRLYLTGRRSDDLARGCEQGSRLALGSGAGHARCIPGNESKVRHAYSPGDALHNVEELGCERTEANLRGQTFEVPLRTSAGRENFPASRTGRAHRYVCSSSGL